MFGLGTFELFMLGVSVVAAIAAWNIAKKKNRSCIIWALLSFIFPVAVLILMVLQAIQDRYPCPNCKEMIVVGAKACHFCGTSFTQKADVQNN